MTDDAVERFQFDDHPVRRNPDADSPFDAIRQVRDDGSEFWSARDLMPLMGYSNWQHFEKPIRRATGTAANQGMDVAALFTRSRKKTGGRPREDFELSRYAAYLVAMNGEPNIREVAFAQHYFAVQTRVAETQPALSEDEIIHRALSITVRRMEELTAEVAELSPKAEAYDAFLDATGVYSLNTVAKMLGIKPLQMFADLRRCGVLMTDGPRRNTPYQKYMHHFSVVAHSYTTDRGNSGSSHTTYVKPSGVDFIRLMLKKAKNNPNQSAMAELGRFIAQGRIS